MKVSFKVLLASALVIMEVWPPPNILFRPNFFPIALACFFFASAHSIPHLLGVHPLDEKYYASEVIQCKDGAKSFTRDRLNDDFCDCIDGTDEPGTSACAAGKFYCRNVGSKPEFIFPSRINDHFCDCCDGTDEYDGGIICPNTCVMGGNFQYKMDDEYSSRFHDAGNQGTKTRVDKADLIQKLTGLKMVIILEVVFIICAVVFMIIRRRLRSKKRRTFTLRSS